MMVDLLQNKIHICLDSLRSEYKKLWIWRTLDTSMLRALAQPKQENTQNKSTSRAAYTQDP